MRRRRGGSSNHRVPGRVRERLAKRLASMGYEVEGGAYGIVGALGRNRIPSCDDTTVCWECEVGFTRLPDGSTRPPLHVVSYDTMTACARGCVADEDGGLLWVTAL